ncbi:MAG: hypothetical protein WA172_00605 [Terriglobales bacterium]
MRPATLLVILLLLSQFAPSLAGASEGGNPSPGGSAQAEFSGDAFDWRETVPYLFAAAALPAEQGIKAVLENSTVLRAYVAKQIRAGCRPDKNPCAATGDSSMLDGEVSKRIDEIVQKGIFHRHKSAIVDYSLGRQPFPFSEIVVLKSEKRQDAYLILQFAGRSYTAADMQDKYGAPYDTDIFQSYSVFKYRLDNADYTSKAVFEVDPVDGAVIKVAISLKPRHNR